jgi:hypothetical protein
VFKASLLVTVTNLVEVSLSQKSLRFFVCYPWFQAVKEHSSSLSGLVVPLIRESLAPEVIQLSKPSFHPYVGINNRSLLGDCPFGCRRANPLAECFA